MEDNVKIYKIGGGKRPFLTRKQKILLKLKSAPFFNSMKWVHNMLCDEFKIPRSTSIGKGFYCSAPLLEIGEHTGLGNLFIIAWAPIKIGSHCSFSFNNTIITSTHDYKEFSTVIGKPVTIGDYVWVTSNVTILPGVTIGSNTVIGAGSVVTKDIPSGVFAAGIPCKVIKEIDFRK